MRSFKSIIKSVLGYVLLIALSLILALLIRVFLCNFYTVPSPSMEPTIQPGDFILANKWTYGARILTSLKFDRNNDPPMVHVPGLGRIKRNDVVVFNFPYRHSWDTIRMDMEKIFVKRCIGLPGDSISVVEGFYHVAGLADALGYIPEQKQLAHNRSTLDYDILNPSMFRHFQWDIINLGPMYIPAKGSNVALTPKNFELYHKLITYETNANVFMKDSLVYINDTLSHDYTFRGNWYWMAGDKVIDSQDSRYLGLIPEAYIIGKASMILTSKDKNTGKRQWNRIFKQIK